MDEKAIRDFLEKDNFARENGARLVMVSPGEAECVMDITDRHRNAVGSVMGGAVFTLIDLAFAAAANALHTPTVAQQASINYLNASKGTRLTAKAVCRKDGRTSCVYNIDVTDDNGKDISQAVITGFKL